MLNYLIKIDKMKKVNGSKQLVILNPWSRDSLASMRVALFFRMLVLHLEGIDPKKSYLRLYSLNTLSGVTSERCPTPQFCIRAHTSRLQRWRVVGNVLEIDRLGI